MRSQKSCQHPDEVRIVDPLDERRGLCGSCGAAVYTKELRLEVERQLRAANREPRRYWWDGRTER